MKDDKIDISGKYLLKAVLLLSGIWVILFYGSALVLPLLVAAIIATLLNRPTEKLKKWGFPDWLAMTVSLILTGIVLLLLFWLVSSQIGNMADEWSTIKEKATEKYGFFSEWAKRTIQIDPARFVDNNIDLTDRLKSISKIFIASFTDLLTQSFIILIYTILFLMQKRMFMRFFKKLVKNDNAGSKILSGSSRIIGNYMFGKGIIMVFLFIVYYLGFTFGQVPFALFLALFAALFSIIPYVGNLIGGGVAIILAYLYSGGTPALIVIAVICVAQLLENYILTPWIIGDKVDLNPFITIFGVILLSVLWGMVGAIIALPVLGVLKVLFQHTDGMEPYTYLLKKHEK
ncbi:Predicted PurR-regulated permease PerM [Pricia antarctica]|uniref:Predicted PurR-regulated permease PerM n=2 Tax=Pricia antarctica TaxID=641691 RepID=A0A1G7I8A2_9FLAO|nr:Predicted PurR-regulated permease PerM [Pricia antarctica]